MIALKCDCSGYGCGKCTAVRSACRDRTVHFYGIWLIIGNGVQADCLDGLCVISVCGEYISGNCGIRATVPDCVAPAVAVILIVVIVGIGCNCTECIIFCQRRFFVGNPEIAVLSELSAVAVGNKPGSILRRL